ncbi:hypothetical protein ABE438_12235 [Bosea sp. TWI1241]|uniref:hypothetical protein n=1 Tax=Bosea sp. TWI1241 TaxID=3148904 RepID=UPI00320B4444
MTPLRARLLPLLPLLALLPAAPAALAGPERPAPVFESRAAEIVLRFVDGSGDDAPRTTPPRLALSFGGAPVHAVMDTGSTGIVVAAAHIPDLEAVPQRGPGTLTYSSSGRIMRGRWVETPVTIAGRDGTRVTTKPLPVLAVERIDCGARARDCQPGPAPRHVAMMGIGFAREADHQPQSTPDKNPLLNLPGQGDGQGDGKGDGASAPGRGYVVTRDAVHIGLTAANTRGFRFLPLARAADGADWAPLPACIALDAGAPACGTALVDTGVSAMYLTTPAAAAAAGGKLKPGTRLTIRFGSADPAAPGYTFAAGDRADAAAPDRIVLVGGRDRPTFVNTSVHALNVFDYLFDAAGGHVGLRPRAR